MLQNLWKWKKKERRTSNIRIFQGVSCFLSQSISQLYCPLLISSPIPSTSGWSNAPEEAQEKHRAQASPVVLLLLVFPASPPSFPLLTGMESRATHVSDQVQPASSVSKLQAPGKPTESTFIAGDPVTECVIHYFLICSLTTPSTPNPPNHFFSNPAEGQLHTAWSNPSLSILVVLPLLVLFTRCDSCLSSAETGISSAFWSSHPSRERDGDAPWNKPQSHVGRRDYAETQEEGGGCWTMWGEGCSGESIRQKWRASLFQRVNYKNDFVSDPSDSWRRLTLLRSNFTMPRRSIRSPWAVPYVVTLQTSTLHWNFT